MAKKTSKLPEWPGEYTVDGYMVIALIDEFRQIHLHSVYLNCPTKEQLVDTLCHRALKEKFKYYLESTKYEYDDPISKAIRDDRIRSLSFFKITSKMTRVEKYLKARLEIIKKELEEEKRQEEAKAEKQKRLKLYEELKKEFESEQ